MSDDNIIDFKPRKPSTEELPHYHSIICELAALTPQDRLSVIAASCNNDDWHELFKLAAYSFGAQQAAALSEKVQDKEALCKAITYPLYCVLKGVIAQATGAEP